MPATIQGNRSRNSSAVPWAATTAKSLGNLITPSPANGLVLVCSAAGTTGGSQPAWSTAPFPTVGTTFSDGSVTWTVIGTQPGNFAPIIQEPVDSDPPIAFAFVMPETTLADQLAWITFFAGKTNANNTWTGTNTFRGTTLTPLVSIQQLGSGVGLEVIGSPSAANQVMTITGANGQIGLQVDGDAAIGQYAILGWAHGGNFAGIRGIGDGSGAGVEGASVGGPGGNFTGGSFGGDGVVGTGGLNGVGGRFTGDPSGAFADGVIGVGGVGGGIGGSFTGGAGGGAGVHGVGTNGFPGVIGQGDPSGLGPGGAFFSSSRHGAVYFEPMAGFPSTPNEGEMTYNLSTHKAYIYDGTSWQPLW